MRTVCFETIELLSRACRLLAERCVTGIQANTARLRELVDSSITVVTALALERQLLSAEQLEHILSPENIINALT